MSSFTVPSSEENRPMFWFRDHGIYAAHLVALIFVVSMVATALLLALRVTAPLHWMNFESAAVLRGQIWRIFTYGLVNPPGILVAINLFLLAWFGREVEQHFGRRLFLWLFAGLYLVTPVLFTALGTWWAAAFTGVSASFGVFVAFATVFPGAPLLFNVTAQWFALVAIGIYSLMGLAARDWTGLLSLWSSCGYAFGFVRYQQGRFTLPDLRFWRRQPKLRVLPDLPPEERAARPQSSPASLARSVEIDAILDKIAQSGFDSLTPAEKARLEAARSDLLQRKGK